MRCLSLLTLVSLLQQAANPLFESPHTGDLPIKLAYASDLSFERTQDSESPFKLTQRFDPPRKLTQEAWPLGKSNQAFDPLYNTAEAAEYIGVRENTLTVWRCVGRYSIEYIKVGRLVRYRKSALDSFLQRRTRGQAEGI